jgi:hypothetical protein
MNAFELRATPIPIGGPPLRKLKTSCRFLPDRG